MSAFLCPHLDSFLTFSNLSPAGIRSPNFVDRAVSLIRFFDSVLHRPLVDWVLLAYRRNGDPVDNE